MTRRNGELFRSDRRLIVNADDFGQTSGINRGIIECHQRGILTSTSLMVTGSALDEAGALARENPALSVGLHFDVWGEDEREFDTHDLEATARELHRQIDEFVSAMGRMPTHIDSHRHAHREEHLFQHFRQWVAPLGVARRRAGHLKNLFGVLWPWALRVTHQA
jgi:predicted glycoside hydrolase/deacetylase ChbG (UPF0249 family)